MSARLRRWCALTRASTCGSSMSLIWTLNAQTMLRNVPPPPRPPNVCPIPQTKAAADLYFCGSSRASGCFAAMGCSSLRISTGPVCCAVCVLYLDTFCVCPCCGYTCHAASHAHSASALPQCYNRTIHAASNWTLPMACLPMALQRSVTGPHILPAMQTWPEAW